jgi:hypothetical protein
VLFEYGDLVLAITAIPQEIRATITERWDIVSSKGPINNRRQRPGTTQKTRLNRAYSGLMKNIMIVIRTKISAAESGETRTVNAAKNSMVSRPPHRRTVSALLSIKYW